MKDWKQYICLHSFTGVVEPAYWRHTSVYILEDNRIMSLLTQLFDIPPLCVENNKIFTQMPTTTTTTTAPPPQHHLHNNNNTTSTTTTTITPPPHHLHMTSHIRGGVKTGDEFLFSLYLHVSSENLFYLRNIPASDPIWSRIFAP